MPPATVDATAQEPEAQNAEPETIHSHSVRKQGCGRLGVVAKMDLVESKSREETNLLTALEVCPVDYKAGAR